MRATKRALNHQLNAMTSAAFEFALSAEEQSFDTPELRALVQRRTGHRQDAKDA